MLQNSPPRLAVAPHCRQPDAQRYLQAGWFPSHPLGFFYPQIPSQAGYKLAHLCVLPTELASPTRNDYLFYKAQLKRFQVPEAILTTVDSEVSSFLSLCKGEP